MWPARLRHPENASSQKQSFVHLLSSWGSPSYCFHRSFWSNALGLKPSDSYQRGDLAPFWEEKMKSITLSSLTSCHHSITAYDWAGSLGCSQPLGSWSRYFSSLDDLLHVFVSSFIPRPLPAPPRTSPDSFVLPSGLSWVCTSQFSNIWKFN